jgi:hypothetical protein
VLKIPTEYDGKIPFRGARLLIHFVGGRNFGVTQKFREAIKSQRFNLVEKKNSILKSIISIIFLKSSF